METQNTKEPLYDVVEVNLKTSKVRILAQGKTERNAEAIVNMAVMRRGCGEEFFAHDVAGRYKDGDTWGGGAQ